MESSPKQQTLFPQRDTRKIERDARAHEGETARQEQDFREEEEEKKRKRRKDRVVVKCAFLRKRLGIGAQSTVVPPMRRQTDLPSLLGLSVLGEDWRETGVWALTKKKGEYPCCCTLRRGG